MRSRNAEEEDDDHDDDDEEEDEEKDENEDEDDVRDHDDAGDDLRTRFSGVRTTMSNADHERKVKTQNGCTNQQSSIQETNM